MAMNDLRALPDRVLKAYLYALAVWAIALALLFPADQVPIALSLCYPLAIYLGVLTVWWWVRYTSPARRVPLAHPEVQAGTRSVGRILAASGLLPGSVFLIEDPLTASSWSALGGAAILSGAGFILASRVTTLANRLGLMALLAATWLVLPISATGSLSIAWFAGWFDRALEIVP